MTSRVVSLSVVLLTVAGTAPAQTIPIQTVPIVPADQFDIFPSSTLAMGGVSIAVPDTLHDPFVNPAKGARLRAARFFSSPTFYSVSRDAGAGRTLPLGAFAPAGAWFGGLALALQQVDASRSPSSPLNTPLPLATAAPLAPSVVDLSPAPQSHGNALAFAMIGKTLPGSGLSVGGSVSWAKLRALDGVDLLYPGSARVKQFGETVDARLGLVKEWVGDRSFEAIVLHERFRMTHDVTFLDAFWDPGTQQFLQSPRLERNRDFSKRWGVQVKYERPLTASGWRIGWHFSNALFRMGVSREVALGPLTKTVALQLGLVVRSVHYSLTQQDHVDMSTHRLEESWLEWTPTWGLSFRFPELELRYRGRVSHGTDRLVASNPNGFIANPVVGGGPGFFPPAGSAMTLDGVHVVTHQFSVSLPLR